VIESLGVKLDREVELWRVGLSEKMGFEFG